MNQIQQPRKVWPGITAAAWLVLSGPVWAATATPTPVTDTTNAPRTAVSTPAVARTARPTYNSFTNIPAINIFNAWRSGFGGEVEPGSRGRPAPTAERFALTGTMSYTKGGTMAFFDGTSPDYRRVLKTGGSIGSFKITEITHDGVKLEAGEQKYELKVNMQLSRPPGGGDWAVSQRTDSYFASADSSFSNEMNGGRTMRMGSSERGEFGEFGNSGGGGGRGGRQRRDRGEFGGNTTFSSPSTPTPSPSNTSSTSSAADTDSIIKKLMEAREKETK
jgi:hypothetical protein